jgi:phage terminase large subunit-like protein
MSKSNQESDAQKVIRFIDQFILVPEGTHVGKPLKLAEFQKQFIRDVYDNPNGTRRAILSIARKSGKTGLISALMLAHIIGPMRKQNSQIISAAMSRDQAALVFNLASKMLDMQPAFQGLYRTVQSSKQIYGLKANVHYKALSAEGTTAHGLSPSLAICDEIGQVRGPMTPFIEAIVTSQGAHDKPLLMTISTQAPSDADLLSLWIDDARRSEDPHTVCHVYEADKDCDLLDKEQWKKANPALGLFRSEKDLEEQLKQASRIPSMEAGARNLLLNQRVAMEHLAFSPSSWKQCAEPIDLQVFREGRVIAGCDLSARNDLTAIVLTAQDANGEVHVLPFVFCPSVGIEDRSRRDKAPYSTWVGQKQMIPVAGKTMDFDQIAASLREELAQFEIFVSEIHYDKHMISHFQAACLREGTFQGATWVGVPQYFKDMGVRLASLQGQVINKKIRTGNHPLLNMAAANAIAVQGREGVSALDKSKATNRIDPLIALVMAAWPFGDGSPAEAEFDVNALIG